MLIGVISVIAALLAVAVCACADAFAGWTWLWLLPVSGLGFFLCLALLVFLLLWFFCAIVRMDVPQQKDSPFYRKMTCLVAQAAITLLQMRVHTAGLENTPKNGRFLLVCNHLNDLDPVVLLWYFRRSQLAFISKRENDRKFLVGKLMHKMMCQPINRENDREALKTVLKCISLLKDDEVSIAVFPEGYTSLDQKLHPFRHGVFKIALKAKVPVVVCTLQNTQHVFGNAARLRPTDVHLHLLGVIPVEEQQALTAVQLGERVHAMMAQDLGPAYAYRPEPENKEKT